MTQKPESRRQRRIRKRLKKEFGGVWRKIWGGPFQEAGFPDLLGCVEGRYISLEVKEPDGELSEIQIDTIEEIIEAGGIAAVVIEEDEAVDIVRNALAGTRSCRTARGQKRWLRALLRAANG